MSRVITVSMPGPLTIHDPTTGNRYRLFVDFDGVEPRSTASLQDPEAKTLDEIVQKLVRRILEEGPVVKVPVSESEMDTIYGFGSL